MSNQQGADFLPRAEHAAGREEPNFRPLFDRSFHAYPPADLDEPEEQGGSGLGKWFDFWFLVLVLVLACVVVVAARAPSAPVPLVPKKVERPRMVRALRQADLSGRWALVWGGSDWWMLLTVDGKYYSGRPGRAASYAGWWAVSEDGERLYVREAYLNSGSRRAEDCPFDEMVLWCASFRRDALRLFDRLSLAGGARYMGAVINVRMSPEPPGTPIPPLMPPAPLGPDL